MTTATTGKMFCETLTVDPRRVIEYFMDADGFELPADEPERKMLARIADYIHHLKINHQPPVIRRLGNRDGVADPGDEQPT